VTRGLPWPRWGNLRRLEPFSSRFGFDRGTPIDRYYLHAFLEQHRHLITGRVLEIQMPAYTTRYGQGVTAAHSVDIVAGTHEGLTYLVDLGRSESVIPDATYDCVLLPNTLCVLRDIDACLRHALRVVRPGGVVLATTAGIGPLTGDGHDLWRMGADGWRVVAERAWPGCEVQVEQHGNCLAAVASMLGLALEELRDDELRVEDPRYPVLVTLVCRKPS
jgi:SAM-dependent methyltransferase